MNPLLKIILVVSFVLLDYLDAAPFNIDAFTDLNNNVECEYEVYQMKDNDGQALYKFDCSEPYYPKLYLAIKLKQNQGCKEEDLNLDDIIVKKSIVDGMKSSTEYDCSVLSIRETEAYFIDCFFTEIMRKMPIKIYFSFNSYSFKMSKINIWENNFNYPEACIKHEEITDISELINGVNIEGIYIDYFKIGVEKSDNINPIFPLILTIQGEKNDLYKKYKCIVPKNGMEGDGTLFINCEAIEPDEIIFAPVNIKFESEFAKFHIQKKKVSQLINAYYDKFPNDKKETKENEEFYKLFQLGLKQIGRMDEPSLNIRDNEGKSLDYRCSVKDKENDVKCQVNGLTYKNNYDVPLVITVNKTLAENIELAKNHSLKFRLKVTYEDDEF